MPDYQFDPITSRISGVNLSLTLMERGVYGLQVKFHFFKLILIWKNNSEVFEPYHIWWGGRCTDAVPHVDCNVMVIAVS